MIKLKKNHNYTNKKRFWLDAQGFHLVQFWSNLLNLDLFSYLEEEDSFYSRNLQRNTGTLFYNLFPLEMEIREHERGPLVDLGDWG